jgi:DNA invertase Pin-like site-specific DNA recombinase
MNKQTRAAAYARISTLLGQDVENQLHGIRELANHRGYSLLPPYSDEGISGKKEKRPGLQRLIADARRGLFSILIVHSIDRLGRSTKHLLNLIDELKHYNVTLISIREGLDFTTPTGQMALTMLSAVAQLEAQLISERIKTSMAVKKAVAESTQNGWKCGRPPLHSSIEREVHKLRAEGASIREISKRLGNVSKSSVSRILATSQNGT